LYVEPEFYDIVSIDQQYFIEYKIIEGQNISPTVKGGILKLTDFSNRIDFADIVNKAYKNKSTLLPFQPCNDDLYIYKEEFIEKNADNYIRARAFKTEIKKTRLGQAQSFPSFIKDYDEILNKTFMSDVVDPIAYGTIDVASVLLSFVELDVIADGFGFVYACARGDFSNASSYSLALIIPGGSRLTIEAAENIYKLTKQKVLKQNYLV